MVAAEIAGIEQQSPRLVENLNRNIENPAKVSDPEMKPRRKKNS